VEAAAVADDVHCQAQAGRLTAMLEQLAPEGIVSFDEHFWLRLAEAYRWDLWGLAYQLNGGCSDDCFVYFRCWLLAAGAGAGHLGGGACRSGLADGPPRRLLVGFGP